MSLKIDLVAISVVVLAAEEVVEAHFVQRRGRGVRRDVAADAVRCAVRADDHGHGIPADQTLDATLDFLAAREGGLIFGADGVDVGRHGGERQAGACHPRMVAEPLEQPLDAAAVTLSE